MVRELAVAARPAARTLAVVSSEIKSQALAAMADVLWSNRAAILSANAHDLAEAKAERHPTAFLDRKGLLIGRMRVPLGVMGVIYEARRGVTADAAALCLKSGNAVILKGGREAIRSNRVISSLLADAAI